MNRLDRTRARYFVPAGLQKSIPAQMPPSVPSASASNAEPAKLSTTHRIADPVPPSSTASATPALSAPRSTSRASSRSAASSTSSASFTPCTYRTSDGRRCRMIRSKDHLEFCAYHAEQELRALERSVAQPLAREILGQLTDLRSGAAVNHAMANLFILSADGRISGRRAASLTYLGQLLLQSLSAVKNDRWQSEPAPSVKQAQRATLIAPLSQLDDEAEEPQNNS